MANRKECPGGQALRAWVKADASRTWLGLAAAVGVSYQSLRQWCLGGNAPEPQYRTLLHALTGVEPDVWATAAEKRKAKRAEKLLERIRASGAA